MVSLLNAYRMKKMANQPQPGGDAEFEQTLSQLASMDIRDRAQTIMDYQVGFQLLDRDRKSNTADGIALFRVNDNWVMIPVLYNKGAIKGTNCMYLADKDKIVPTTEAYVQKLINAPGRSLGKSVLRNDRSLSLDPAPDFSALIAPNVVKYGNIRVTRLPREAVKIASKLMETMKTKPERKSLRLKEAIHDCGNVGAFVLSSMFRRSPELMVNFHNRYGLDCLKQAASRSPLKSVPKRLLPPRQEKTASSVIVRSFTGSSILPSTADPFDYASPRGVSVKDNRNDDEVSKVYEISIQQSGVSNPSRSGIYDIVCNGGALQRCLVLASPEGEYERKGFCTVVRLENPNFGNYPMSRIFGMAIADGNSGPPMLDDLEDVKPSSLNGDDYYVIVAPDGNGTCPFSVIGDVSTPDEDDGTVFKVNFRDYRDESPASWSSEDRNTCYRRRDDEQRADFIRLSGSTGSKIVRIGNELIVPVGSKIITAYKNKSTREKYVSRQEDEGCPPIRLGAMHDIDLALNRDTSAVKVGHAAGGYYIDGRYRTPSDSFSCLVKDYGLRAKTADAVLDRADALKSINLAFDFRIKKASPMPNWPLDNYMHNTGGEFSHVPEMASLQAITHSPQNPTGPSEFSQNMVEQDPMVSIQNAMQSGHDDIVDAGMLGALLRSSQSSTIVSRYRQDLADAVDRLGRISLHMAKVPEVYEEQYGRSDAMLIEEETNECFERLGKLVLQLSDNQIGADDNDQIVSDLSAL